MSKSYKKSKVYGIFNGSDKEDKVMAFVRTYNGKSLLVIANQDMNARHTAKIAIPTLKANQKLEDLVPQYGAVSKIVPSNDGIVASVAPGRVHVFEIDTPEIASVMEKRAYRQNLDPSVA